MHEQLKQATKDVERFLEHLRRRTEEEIKKKERSARENLDSLIRQILWDFPLEERVVNRHSLPVLKRRLARLPLPDRRALEQMLKELEHDQISSQS
ncbi:MAG: hypothetical protein D6681_04965 [Calditrichaeota bacterium]|nr:MAG: hypothetical protein D6681_04965 [Calditrichota bacterium]